MGDGMTTRATITPLYVHLKDKIMRIKFAGYIFFRTFVAIMLLP